MSSVPETLARLTAILAEILVLNEEEIRPSSKLVDDLDADSIAFLELTYRLGKDFGLEVPEAKVDEETLRLPLLEGLARLEKKLGGTTLFEFMQLAALRADVQDAALRARLDGLRAQHPSLAGLVDAAKEGAAAAAGERGDPRPAAGGAQDRGQLAEIRIGELSDLMATTPPRGFDPAASIATLQLRDLFRFITVESYVRYVLYLSMAKEEGREAAGAAALDEEMAAWLRGDGQRGKGPPQ